MAAQRSHISDHWVHTGENKNPFQITQNKFIPMLPYAEMAQECDV